MTGLVKRTWRARMADGIHGGTIARAHATIRPQLGIGDYGALFRFKLGGNETPEAHHGRPVFMVVSNEELAALGARIASILASQEERRQRADMRARELRHDTDERYSG